MNIKVIANELFKKFDIRCNNQRLYKAKNKALEILGQDYKVDYTKLYRYMHAILNFNFGSIITINRNKYRIPILKICL